MGGEGAPRVEPRGQRLGRGAVPAAHAEAAGQLLDRPAMPLHRQAAVQPERLGGDLGHDRGVAVAVAADPGGDGQPGGRRSEAGVVARDGGLEIGADARQQIPEDLVHEVEPGAHLVGDRGPGGAGPVGEPERGDLRLERLVELAPPARQQVPVEQPAEDLADALELREHGAALGLGGVRGQDQLDPERGEQGRHARGIDAPRPEQADRLADRLPDGSGMLGPLAGAEGLDAVHFLGEVDQVEVDREGGGGGARGLRGQLGDRARELDRGLHLARAPGLGQGADALLRLEERDGFLRAEHLTEGFAEQVDGGREIHENASSGSTTACGAAGGSAGKRSVGASGARVKPQRSVSIAR